MNAIKIAPLMLIFAEVARLGSFTLAGKKLNLSKSAVSQQIKRLEEALDTQLLSRNSRGLSLTIAGERLLERSALLNEQLTIALNDIKSEQTQPSGVFRVSIPPFFERSILVPALRQLSLEYPLITPHVEVTGRWQDLIDNNLDAAIFGGKLKDSEYKAQSIGKVRDVFCCSPNYLKQAQNLTKASDIVHHPFIATPWQRDSLNLYDTESKQFIVQDTEHRFFTTSLNTLVDMTLSDMGIALIPEFIAHQEWRLGRLVRVLPHVHGNDWHFYYLHRYTVNKPAHVARFYSLISHYFAMANSDL